jgi:hypothetical protein
MPTNSFKTFEINNAATQRNIPDILNPQIHVYLHKIMSEVLEKVDVNFSSQDCSAQQLLM